MFTSLLSCRVSPCAKGLDQVGKEDTISDANFQSRQTSVVKEKAPGPSMTILKSYVPTSLYLAYIVF